MPRRGPPFAVLAALVAVQVLFGVHYTAAKLILREIPPLPWAALRIGSAALVLLALGRWRAGRPAPGLPGDTARIAGLAVLGVMVNQICFVVGLSYTTPTHAALINACIPVLALLFGLGLGSERGHPLKMAAVAVSLAGVLLLLRVDRMTWDTTTSGDLITLVNASSFSLFLVLSRPLMRRRDPLQITAYLFAWGAVGLVPLGLPGLWRLQWSAIRPATWMWALYAVLGATVLTYVLNAFALGKVESSLVALFIYLQPLVAAILDVALLDARPTLRLAVSAATIFVGVGLAARAGQQTPAPALPRGT